MVLKLFMNKPCRKKCCNKALASYLSFLSVLIASASPAQQLNIPLAGEFNYSIERTSARIGSGIHTGIKPYISANAKEAYNYDSLIFNKDKSKSRSWFYRKLFRESFIVVDTGNFQLAIDPLITLEKTYDPDDTTAASLYTNTRGVMVRGNIGENFSFETSFYESQARFQRYISNHIRTFEIDNDSFFVIPGQGRAKRFKGSAFDFASSAGYISFKPVKFLNIQAGHGKHFIGDGYRSLLLSDNSFNYPYLKFTATIGKFNYTALYSSLMIVRGGAYNISQLSERIFRKKTATFHYLSYSPIKRLELGLFEGTVWKVKDKDHPYFDFNALNPILFSAALQNGLAGKSNTVLGFNGKIKLTDNLQVYGQYVLDELPGETINKIEKNKAGFQAGFKWFDILKIKDLYFQSEYNKVNPFTYAHKIPVQSYTHYNQPLAHPLGAGFQETVSTLSYTYKRISLTAKGNYIQYLTGENFINSGRNIFLSENSITNPSTRIAAEKIIYKQATLSYVINPVTNLSIYAEVLIRDEINDINTNIRDRFVYAGIRTSLRNIYYDF